MFIASEDYKVSCYRFSSGHVAMMIMTVKATAAVACNY